MVTRLPWYFIILLFFAIATFLLHNIKLAQSAVATHLVISEIQVSGDDADDEFIELYNPTNSAVDLSGFRVTRKPQDGDPETSIISSMSGTIPAKGFFLLANNESYASPSADLVYASSLAANNTLLLYSDSGITLIDKVGMGTAADSEASASAQLPPANQSIERKANSSSTPDSMSSGADQNQGNGEDTNNNSNDFILRATPQPQNSQAAIEPTALPTDSPTPTPTPTPEPTITPTPSPTLTPTPSASASPSASPTATLRFRCDVTFRIFQISFMKIKIPRISCGLRPA